MYQKDLIRRAWEEAGLYRSRDAKLQRFLARLDDPGECWSELVEAATTEYSAYLPTLARPLWETGDSLVRLNLIRAADLEDPPQRAIVEDWIRRAGSGDAQELHAIARIGDLPLVELVARKRSLPPQLRDYVLERRSLLARGSAPIARGA
jgi:hypothetical protein